MKSLFGRKTDESEIEAVGFAIAKMTLEPGDVIVLRFPGRITSEKADLLRKMIGEALGGRKCLILENGLDIGILSKDEIDRRAA